jgi:hypothetical protein
VARDDLAIINAHQKSDGTAAPIETEILLAEGRPRDAYTLNMTTNPQEPGDWLVRAAVFDAVADDATTTLPERTELKRKALELRARYGQDPDYNDD